MNKKIRKLLYRSFDDQLSSKEQQLLENTLKVSEELQKEKEQIMATRSMVSGKSAGSFNPSFADDVMRSIRQKNAEVQNQSFWESLVFVFRPVMIAATVLIIALISYNLIQSGTVSLAEALAEPEVTLEQAVNPTILLTLE